MTAPATPLLAIRSLRAAYGKIEALKGVDLDINNGEIVALIGANGAGKSTLMMTIFGKPRARAGTIQFDGADITDVPTHQIARLRIAQAPEGRRIFPRMSVAENLQMGADATDGNEADRAAGLERVFTLFPRLKERMTQRGGTLSGGEQQMLALARALAVSPKLIIADELSLGLAPLVTEAVFESLAEARQSGITVILSEQFVHRALAMADACVILTRGRVGWSGPASEAGQEVIDRYLGEGEAATPTLAT